MCLARDGLQAVFFLFLKAVSPSKTKLFAALIACLFPFHHTMLRITWYPVQCQASKEEASQLNLFTKLLKSKNEKIEELKKQHVENEPDVSEQTSPSRSVSLSQQSSQRTTKPKVTRFTSSWSSL